MNRIIVFAAAVTCLLFVLLPGATCTDRSDAPGSVNAPQRQVDATVTVPDIPARPAPLAMSKRTSAPTADDRLRTARALILDQLRDPAGARFRNERLLQDGEVVCMEVDAKDGAGTHAGYSKAVVIVRPDRAPSVWIDRGRELVAHTACEVA